MRIQRVLLTGATGFVGNELHDELRARVSDVRCGSRTPEKAQGQHPERQFIHFDADDVRSVMAALDGCDAAVYLVHSMGDGDDYEQREQEAATRFVLAAEQQGVRRIVFLGGIEPSGEPSKHLRSRLATGEALRAGSVSTIELRSSMIVGARSESWRIVRDLASRLPVMVLPKWLDHRMQPVWIGDVVHAIAAALLDDLTDCRVFTIPGPDLLSGKEMLEAVARLQGMDPYMMRVPLLSPRLSSYWISLVTRARPEIASQLVEGLTSDVVADEGDDVYWRRMGAYRPVPFLEAARRALSTEDELLPLGARLVEGAIHSLPIGKGRS